MPRDEIPPPPPSPPQPPLHPAAGHSPVHVHHQPQPQPQPRPQPRPAAAAMFGEHHDPRQGPTPEMLDRHLPRTANGNVATRYLRFLFTVQDPPAGQRRTWARAHTQVLSGDSQEALRKIVQTEEKATKLKGRKWLSMKDMTPEKRRQIEGLLAHHHRIDPDPRFEWLPGMIRLRTEKAGDVKFTRSMDVIIKRVPRAIIVQHPTQAQQQPQMYPHPHPQQHPQQHPHANMPHQPHPQGHQPDFAGARAAAMAAMAAAGGGGGGIEVLDNDIVDMGKGGKKKDKGDKKHKPEVHNNKPRAYSHSHSHSTSESDSDGDSVFSDSDFDTPHSSISGDPRRRRRSSAHKHTRRTSETHGVREHKRRPAPRERPELRSHHSHQSRRGSTSSYNYEAQAQAQAQAHREEEARRFHEQEIRLARAEGMLQGMSMNDRHAPPAPHLQINDRAQYPSYSRPARFSRGSYYR